MKIYFLPEAEDALLEIASWVESKNTSGSGLRFTDKFIAEIETYALQNVRYSKCRNKTLAAFKLSCININNWTVAFTLKENEFVVHYILWSAALA